MDSGMDKILGFKDDWRFLSNFWDDIEPIQYLGLSWPTTEHAYQAAKFTDPTIWAELAGIKSPGAVKRRATELKAQWRPDWHMIKETVMLEVIRLKYYQPRMAYLLLSTGKREIVELNTHGDDYWGAVPLLPFGYRGQNRLGVLTMQVRDEVQALVDCGHLVPIAA